MKASLGSVLILALLVGAPIVLSGQPPGQHPDCAQPPPTGQVGQEFKYQFCAQGGQPGYTWTVVEGELPPGLALDPASGLLSGVPQGHRRKPFQFMVRVEDSAGAALTRAYRIVIAPPPFTLLNPSGQAMELTNPVGTVPSKPATNPVASEPVRPPAEPPPPSLEPPRAGALEVKGTGEPGARLELTVDEKTPKSLVCWVNNETGGFVCKLQEPLKAGSKVRARQKLGTAEEEVRSEFSVPVAVVPEVPPPVIEQPLISGEKQLSGSASAGARVSVRVNNRAAGEKAADPTGKFKVDLKDPLREGERVEVRQMVGGAESAWSAAEVEDECPRTASDCRGIFEGTFYTALSIDTFAAGELRRYLNPEESNDSRQRFVAGINFGYRLVGDSYEKAGLRSPQLWVYGETVHGARSADLDCEETPDAGVCDPFDPATAGERTLAILRNASSLEAFMGARWEFFTLQADSDSPANLYFKTQYGFLTAKGGGDDVADVHQYAALGLVGIKGRFEGSYLEIGYGRTDLFQANPKKRWKIDGLLSWKLPLKAISTWMQPFAQMTVDSDFGRGSDSIQTYLGLDFDLDQLFKLNGK